MSISEATPNTRIGDQQQPGALWEHLDLAMPDDLRTLADSPAPVSPAGPLMNTAPVPSAVAELATAASVTEERAAAMGGVATPGVVERVSLVDRMGRLARRWRARRIAASMVGSTVAEDAATVEAGPSATEVLREQVAFRMNAIGERFKTAVANHELVVPDDENVQMNVRQVDASEAALPDGWTPRAVYKYSSVDPWGEANPQLVAASHDLIADTTAVIADVAAHVDGLKAIGGNPPKGLTYENNKRNAGGKNPTIITQGLINIDPGLGGWIGWLPKAEGLRPVLHPNGGMYVQDPESGEIRQIASSDLLAAICAGSKNGWGVRERGALGTWCVGQIDPATIQDGVLRLADIGSGTGEAGMLSGASKLPQLGPDGRLLINGYDNSASSLAVAIHIAKELGKQLDEPSKVEFNGHLSNITQEPALRHAVRSARARFYQSIGLTEYVPAENSTNPEEQRQRAIMKRLGMVSAEEFHAIVYEEMEEGAVWLTGNMMPNEESKFVEQALGWGSILIRDLEAYMTVFRDSGIPEEAIEVFLPEQGNSSEVYCLVRITKLPAPSLN